MQETVDVAVDLAVAVAAGNGMTVGIAGEHLELVAAAERQVAAVERQAATAEKQAATVGNAPRFAANKNNRINH